VEKKKSVIRVVTSSTDDFLKKEYLEIEIEETADIPQWHNDIVSERLNNYQLGKDPKTDFDKAVDDIENPMKWNNQ
jgi:hypothetical protein